MPCKRLQDIENKRNAFSNVQQKFASPNIDSSRGTSERVPVEVSMVSNFNLSDYSFTDIMNLFELKFPITLTDMRNTKQAVLKMHPDKSRLPPEYFLFYKKAFDVIVDYYNNENKMNQEVIKQSYKDRSSDFFQDDREERPFMNANIEEFQHTFNRLFEENQIKSKNPPREDWKKESFAPPPKVGGQHFNHRQFTDIKKQIREKDLVVYRDIRELHHSIGGSNLYDEDEAEETDRLIESEPFAKLKYEDVNRVHYKETILPVGLDSDFQKVPTRTIQELNTLRQKQPLDPIGEMEARRLLAEKESQWKNRMIQKEFESKKKSMMYEEKNKSVMAHFLRLGWL